MRASQIRPALRSHVCALLPLYSRVVTQPERLPCSLACPDLAQALLGPTHRAPLPPGRTRPTGTAPHCMCTRPRRPRMQPGEPNARGSGASSSTAAEEARGMQSRGMQSTGTSSTTGRRTRARGQTQSQQMTTRRNQVPSDGLNQNESNTTFQYHFPIPLDLNQDLGAIPVSYR